MFRDRVGAKGVVIELGVEEGGSRELVWERKGRLELESERRG